jgi:hypothetical protein
MPYLITASVAGIIYGMKASEQKITVHVDRDLLASARNVAKGGITDTVRKGLQLLAAKEAYAELRKMRGKVKFSIDLKELREDKR